ncbi:hypothetical protein JCM10295v2_003984 [Rhodotorula toruloides]
MSASDLQALVAARSLAVVGLGLNTGLMLSIPALSIPALKATTSLTAQQRLTLWSNLYEKGKAVMVKLQPTLTLLLAYASYAAARPVDYLPANTVARYRKPILAVASALTISIVGFTGVAIMPLNKRMQKMEREASVASTAQADSLIGQWSRLHAVRIALGSTAFALADRDLRLTYTNRRALAPELDDGTTSTALALLGSSRWLDDFLFSWSNFDGEGGDGRVESRYGGKKKDVKGKDEAIGQDVDDGVGAKTPQDPSPFAPAPGADSSASARSPARRRRSRRAKGKAVDANAANAVPGFEQGDAAPFHHSSRVRDNVSCVRSS